MIKFPVDIDPKLACHAVADLLMIAVDQAGAKAAGAGYKGNVLPLFMLDVGLMAAVLAQVAGDPGEEGKAEAKEWGRNILGILLDKSEYLKPQELFRQTWEPVIGKGGGSDGSPNED